MAVTRSDTLFKSNVHFTVFTFVVFISFTVFIFMKLRCTVFITFPIFNFTIFINFNLHQFGFVCWRAGGRGAAAEGADAGARAAAGAAAGPRPAASWRGLHAVFLLTLPAISCKHIDC